MLALGITVAVLTGLVAFSSVKLNSSMLHSIESANVALQAQQYAAARADKLRGVNYKDLKELPKTSIKDSNGYFEEVTLGPETPSSDNPDVMHRDLLVNVYKDNNSISSASLRIPVSSDNSGESGNFVRYFGNSSGYEISKIGISVEDSRFGDIFISNDWENPTSSSWGKQRLLTNRSRFIKDEPDLDNLTTGFYECRTPQVIKEMLSKRNYDKSGDPNPDPDPDPEIDKPIDLGKVQVGLLLVISDYVTGFDGIFHSKDSYRCYQQFASPEHDKVFYRVKYNKNNWSEWKELGVKNSWGLEFSGFASNVVTPYKCICDGVMIFDIRINKSKIPDGSAVSDLIYIYRNGRPIYGREINTKSRDGLSFSLPFKKGDIVEIEHDPTTICFADYVYQKAQR